jgi:hypothetical protein
MQFYVIYEFDAKRGESVKPYNPPFRSRNFPLTECEESEFTSHDVKPGQHRKYAGILTKAQFKALVSDQCLYMEELPGFANPGNSTSSQVAGFMAICNQR